MVYTRMYMDPSSSTDTQKVEQSRNNFRSTVEMRIEYIYGMVAGMVKYACNIHSSYVGLPHKLEREVKRYEPALFSALHIVIICICISVDKIALSFFLFRRILIPDKRHYITFVRCNLYGFECVIVFILSALV